MAARPGDTCDTRAGPRAGFLERGPARPRRQPYSEAAVGIAGPAVYERRPGSESRRRHLRPCVQHADPTPPTDCNLSLRPVVALLGRQTGPYLRLLRERTQGLEVANHEWETAASPRKIDYVIRRSTRRRAIRPGSRVLYDDSLRHFRIVAMLQNPGWNDRSGRLHRTGGEALFTVREQCPKNATDGLRSSSLLFMPCSRHDTQDKFYGRQDFQLSGF